MALIDSVAAFEQRCRELSQPGLDLKALLEAQSITTFSSLAFVCGTPNRAPTDEEFDRFSQTIFGAGANAGRVSVLRRLHFEASTFVLSQLKATVTGDTGDGSKKLPFAEKQSRLAGVRTALAGFLIQGETEPSHTLIDKCQLMYDTGSVMWLHPSLCTKRDLEIQSAPKDSQQVLKIESQTLKVDTEAPKIGDADHGTEIKLQWCLQRRGVALEMCNILSWDVSQRWLATLFQAYSTEPPPGYGKVTLQQLVRADKEMWTLLGRDISSVKPDAAGIRPLDKAVKNLMTDARITMHLLALPYRSPGTSTGSGDKPSSSSSRPSNVQPKKKMRAGKKMRTPASPPEELKDCHQTTADGKPICWSYNLACKCDLPTSGQPPRCRRGVHICAFCRKVGHSFQQCKAAPHHKVGGS